MIDLPDRRARLADQSDVLGIDFVRVVDPCEQTRLWIYFIEDPQGLMQGTLALAASPPTLESIRIVSTSGGERLTRVPVIAAQVVADPVTGRRVLQVDTAEPGDFSSYRLTIEDPRIDVFFNGIVFSFKQGCEPFPALDCKPPEKECPPDPEIAVDIDYLARDYDSFKRALLDFAAQRYPTWNAGNEADVATMILELYAALGDELSYIQDRYAHEAHLETATQRRSLRQHARLMDYEIHDGRSASTYLDLEIDGDPSQIQQVGAGSRVWATFEGEGGVAFEVGVGLGKSDAYSVAAAWNVLLPYAFDETRRCLPCGSTEIYIEGHPIDTPETWLGGPSGSPQKRLLLWQREDVLSNVPDRRWLVRLIDVDPTLRDPLLGRDITRLVFEPPTPFELDLVFTSVRANLVPATAGQRFSEEFTIGAAGEGVPDAIEQARQTSALDVVGPAPGPAPLAVEREGPLRASADKRPTIYRYSPRRTESLGLGWLGDDLRATQPELELVEMRVDGSEPTTWRFQRRILDSEGSDRVFTLEDGTWRPVIRFDRGRDRIEHQDYASGSGFTLRFGDGDFGQVPETSQDERSYFRVTYRDGPGTRANVARDTITNLHGPDGMSGNMPPFVASATNPLSVTDGVDPEDPEVIRQLVPDAWRASTERAVRPEDYAEQAERLEWVQRASGRFRWTGSWLSVVVAADPRGSFELSPERRAELESRLDCVRQAGREVIVRDPRFVPIDLEIAICVAPTAYPGEVAARVLQELTGKRPPRPIVGFFDPDNFTFGTPLRRAALEARIQGVHGVRAVEGMRIRPRGIERLRSFTEFEYTVADDEILRLENDPSFPERGILRLQMEGGA